MAITSKKVASQAAKLIKKDMPRKNERSVAASALRQTERRGKK